MDEADAAVQLGVAGQAFLDAGHADEDHTQSVLIENGAQLLQAVHGQAICFIHDDQGSGIWDRFDSGLVFVEDVVVCRLEGQGVAFHIMWRTFANYLAHRVPPL